MNWRGLKYLLPALRRNEERDMQEELESLQSLAGPTGLGNLTLAAENARQTWHLTAFDGVFADIRYALRTLRRQPGLVAVAVLSLALGIGANSAIFSFADGILLRPIPVPRPAEVLSVSNSTPDKAVEGLSYPDYRDLRAQNHSFAGLIAYRATPLSVGASPGAQPQMRLAMMVSDNFFGVLGIDPSLGRALLPEEGTRPGRDPVALLSYDFWKTQFGGDGSVVGRTLRLNGVDFTVVGIAPESFTGMDLLFRPAVFVPLSMWASLSGEREDPLEDRGRHELTVKGRLVAASSRKSARAELAMIGNNLETGYPKTNRDRHVAVRTELDARIQQEPVRLALVTMLVVLVVSVLVIACVNVANLMLARARARSREVAIRLAIGAGRLRLIRQLMIEGLILALAGGLAGLGCANAGMRFLSTLQVSSDIPIILGLELDSRVLVFSVFVTVGSCLLFGLVPALQAARTDLVPALKSAGEAVSANRRMIGRDTLVAGQIALAMLLLIIAGLFLDNSRSLLGTNPGFQTDHRISMGLDPSALRYSPAQSYDFHHKLVDRLRALPAVRSVALAGTLPYSPDQVSVAVIPEGYRFPKGREKDIVFGGAFGENYFSTMKIGIVRGRAFTPDDRTSSRRVAVVNEEFARIYWAGQDPIGKRLRLDRSNSPEIEIVGVAKTGRYLVPTEPPRPYVYLPYEQNPRTRMTVVVESRGDPAALAGQMRDAVRAIDADQPVLNLRTLAVHEARAVNNWMIFVKMFAAIGLVGLALAMIGLYGLVSYSVSRRIPEMGVRMAIGASQGDVLWLVLRQGLSLAGMGIAAGGVLAIVTAPALTRAAMGPGTMDIATYIVIPGALLAASVAACYLPARRAARLDPLRSLRCE